MLLSTSSYLLSGSLRQGHGSFTHRSERYLWSVGRFEYILSRVLQVEASVSLGVQANVTYSGTI